jgi:hypothetical protein
MSFELGQSHQSHLPYTPANADSKPVWILFLVAVLRIGITLLRIRLFTLMRISDPPFLVDADLYLIFSLMRIRICLPEMMRIHPDPYPQHLSTDLYCRSK